MVKDLWDEERGLSRVVVAIIGNLLESGTSWTAIARAVGGPVDEVRRAYEKAQRREQGEDAK